MFEREIKFIYDFNLNKVNRLGPYFTFEQLNGIDVHPAIMNYISAEIDYLIFEDRQNLLKNSIFDYSGEKISNHFNLISEEVKKSKRFSLEYISKLILHASSFTVNYLVRPKWTLSKFVFDEGDHKTTLEIKQILNYVYYYQYLKKILISYINSKKIISMNSSEFIELLERVDKLGIETYLPNILSHAVKSMSDFFNIGEIQKNKIPFLAVEKFLEEKNLNKHLNKIHSVFGDDNSIKINIADLQKSLDSVMMEKFEQEPVRDVTPDEEIREEILPVQEPEVILPDDDKKKNIYEEEILPEDSIGETDTNLEKPIDEEEEIPESSGIEDYETLRPTKLRIRIDKNNEIEPVIEEDSITNEEEIEGHEIIDALEPEPEDSLNQVPDNEIKTDKVEPQSEEPAENVFVNEQDLVEEVDLTDETEEIIEDDLHPDKVYEQILDEDKENEESMLQAILQSSQEKSEDLNEILEEKSIDDLSNPKMDVAELLEHKEMTKIIEVIFDYDIEEFANTLDEISGCQSLDDAFVVINQSLKNRSISSNSKEAESFKSIISQYFNKK
ncbi:MAG: hypothetical protein KGZ42_12910 [Melioribacter sp.]|nr:hypothetical protein [Melioribacter sp.]